MVITGNCMTIKGKMHIDKGMPCQDCSGVLLGDGYAITAIADGHSSIPHIRSEIGSKFAIISAFEVIDSESKTPDYPSKVSDENYIKNILGKKIVERWVKHVVTHFNRNPLSTKEKTILGSKKIEIAEKSLFYGSTLIVAVMGDDYYYGFQIGDGGVLLLNSDFSLTDPISVEDDKCNNDYTSSLCESVNGLNLRYFIKTSKNTMPIGFATYTDGFSGGFVKDDLKKHLNGIICLSQKDKTWYGSVAKHLKMCSDRTLDDTSVSLIVNGDINFDKFYEKTFRLKSPGIISRNDPYNVKICADGDSDGVTFTEKIFWKVGGDEYNGSLKNGNPESIKIGWGDSPSNTFVPMSDHCFTLDGNFTIRDKNDVTIYQGALSSGKYDGAGIVMYEYDAPRLKGTFHKGVAEGKFIEYYRSGAVKYVGQFMNGHYSGPGKEYYDSGNTGPNQLKREGNYENGLLTGIGHEYHQNGNMKYEGSFSNGSYCGKGTSYRDDGSKEYEGVFGNGLPNGYALEYNKNGDLIFKGTFFNGKYEGDDVEYRKSIRGHELHIRGRFEKGAPTDAEVYIDGKLEFRGLLDESYSHANAIELSFKHGIKYKDATKLFEGSFEKGLYLSGTLYDITNGMKIYEGSFYDGQYSGTGKLYSTEKGNPLRFSGRFRNGKKLDGTLYQYGKPYFDGLFQNDLPIRGKLIDLDSRVVYEGDFKDGQIQGKGVLYNYTNESYFTIKNFFKGGLVHNNDYFQSHMNNIAQIERQLLIEMKGKDTTSKSLFNNNEKLDEAYEIIKKGYGPKKILKSHRETIERELIEKANEIDRISEYHGWGMEYAKTLLKIYDELKRNS